MKTTILKTITILFIAALAACSAMAQTTSQDSAKAVKNCIGVKVDKTPCNSTIINKAGYCSHHDPNAVKCAGKNAKGQPCGMTVKKKGEYCRFHQPE